MDSPVHSEWSWDAPGGTMLGSCVRAVALGLPAVAFTEHADHTPWVLLPRDLQEHANLQAFATAEGTIQPPPLDLDGYLESLHSLPLGERFSEMPTLFSEQAPEQVMRDYLAEVVLLIQRSDAFEVLAHIGYAARYWPQAAGPFHAERFEQEFRHALRTLAESGRTLEVNTRAALLPEVVGWWREEGGRDVTFGSDAHDPTRLAFQFQEAAAMVEAHGFRPGRDPWDVWSLPG